MKAYCISLFRRLCSSTSLGRVAKSGSSVAIRDESFSISLLTAAVSYDFVSTMKIINRVL